jgi:hypothetical protein
MAVTWNPSDKHANITLSESDLRASNAASLWAGVRATMSKNSGKWYWEVYVVIGGTRVDLGIGDSSANLGAAGGSDGHSYTYDNNGKKRHSEWDYGSTYGTNDIIGIALDLDAGKIWWAKNNVWQASGNPVAGTNPAFSSISGDFFPIVFMHGLQESSIRAHFNTVSFSFAPPGGFVSLEQAPPTYYFSGHIYELQEPVSRKLFLYDRVGGGLITTTTSSGDGYYYMETSSSGSHNIVCLDDEVGVNYNDLISGNVFPATVSG